MDAIAENLLKSPKLGLYVQQFQNVLQSEEKKRQAFYAQITLSDKAEFINGEMIFHSPVRLRHNNAGSLLYLLLKTYVNKHDLGLVGYEKLLISLTRNDYEPDICYFSKEKADMFSPNQMRFPAPDLVVEIVSPSTEKNDRGIKFEDYAAHGVAEYWIIDPKSEVVEQYVLKDGTYALLTKANNGLLHSMAVNKFTIPIRAIFDEAVNLTALQTLLANL